MYFKAYAFCNIIEPCDPRCNSFEVINCYIFRLVDFLIEKFKASIYDRTKDGSTLMHIAAINGHPETAVLLFNKGVPLLMPNKYGARGIHIAAKEGHITVIKTLLAKGEKIDAKTSDNKTALHIAVENGKSSAVEVKS